MATDNSRFLAIPAKPLNIDTGWQIRIRDYKDMTTLVAICNEFDSFSFTQQLNDPGTGTISIDTDSPWWNNTLNNGSSARSILNNEYVFEAWESGVPRFAWLAQTVENTVIGEDETHKTTISGPGIAQVLSWACIMRPGWPKKPPKVGLTPAHKPLLRSHSYQDSKPAYIWQFPQKWPTMRMWTTVFMAAQRRGLLRFVKPQFSGTYDSARKKWYYIKTLQTIVDNHGYQPEELNENLLEFLNDCTGQDYTKWFGQRLEWLMETGFRLKVQTRIGTDRSKNVRFYAGQILSNERTRDREQIYNRVTAVDVDGTESIRTDATSVRAWNLREQRNETNKNITDNTLRGNLADRYIKQSKDEKSQWTIKIPYDEPGRVPFHNFYVGDSIMLANTSSAGGLNKYRVMAISISQSAEALVPDVELTLQSVIDSRMNELQKQITQIVNQPRNFSLKDLKDIKIPEAPKVKSGLTYNPETSKWEATPITESSTSIDPGGGSGGGGTGRVFIQAADPSVSGTVTPGDFWLETYD